MNAHFALCWCTNQTDTEPGVEGEPDTWPCSLSSVLTSASAHMQISPWAVAQVKGAAVPLKSPSHADRGSCFATPFCLEKRIAQRHRQTFLWTRAHLHGYVLFPSGSFVLEVEFRIQVITRLETGCEQPVWPMVHEWNNMTVCLNMEAAHYN